MPLKLVPPRSGKSPFWYIRGKIYGRLIDASTKARDKAAAKRFKDDFEIELAKSAGQHRRAATFKEAADLYLNYRRLSKAQKKMIERLSAVIGSTFLQNIRQHTLVRAAETIYPSTSPATRNRQALTPAAAVLHYAAENDLCPYIRVRKLKEKKPEPRALRKEDAAKLIDKARGQLKLLLIFLFHQGWRITDALRLTWNDLDFEAATVRYHIGKTDEWLIMPLHQRVLNVLKPAGKGRVGRVFHWGNKSNLYRDLRPFCKKLKIRFTPHMARHSFATWLVNEGATMPELMDAGGWRDHKSVLRYAKLDGQRVRATINKIKT